MSGAGFRWFSEYKRRGVVMTLAVNLRHSRDACNYVLKTIKVKGANWDQYRGSSTSYEGCVASGGATCTVL